MQNLKLKEFNYTGREFNAKLELQNAKIYKKNYLMLTYKNFVCMHINYIIQYEIFSTI